MQSGQDVTDLSAARQPAEAISGPPAPRRHTSPPRWLAIVAVLVAALIWSSSFAVTKVALAEVPPLTIGALRFSAAAAVLGVIVHLRPGSTLPSRRQRALIGVAGLLGITVYFALENLGVDLATASDATLIVASYPLITLSIELVCKRTSFAPVRLVGMLLAIVGVWLVVQNGAQSGGSEHRVLGDLILIVGGVVWAGFNLIAQRDESGASPIVVTYYQTLAGAAGFLMLAPLESDQWALPSPGIWLRIGFLAIFCSIAAFLCYNYALTAIPASAAVNLLNIVPVAGIGWAVALAGERLSVGQLIGGATVVAGVSLGLVNGSARKFTASRHRGVEK